VVKNNTLHSIPSNEVLTVEREYQKGILLSYLALKQLSNWLIEKVKEFESILKKKEDKK